MASDKDHLRKLTVGGRIIIKQILKAGYEGANWIHLSLDKVQ
jgi:hypothetical protein